MTADLVKPAPRGWTFRRRFIISGIIFFLPALGFSLIQLWLYLYYSELLDIKNISEIIFTIYMLIAMLFMMPIFPAMMPLAIIGDIFGYEDFDLFLSLNDTWAWILLNYAIYSVECALSLWFRRGFIYYWLAMFLLPIILFTSMIFTDKK